MSYQSRNDLPESIRKQIPSHAHEVYRVVYNAALQIYGGDATYAQYIALVAVGMGHLYEQPLKTPTTGTMLGIAAR